MCRNCGAIVGAGEPQCAVCGTPNAQAPDQLQNYRPADRETIRFARAILSRPNIFTIVVLIANLFVFMLMWQSSGLTVQALWQAFPEPVLVAYGAKVNYLINAPHHQWWRFITPMFVHINLPHLLVNMYSLWIVGPYVEKLYGSAKFITFWVVTGIAGVVASYLSVQPRLATGGFGRFLFKTTDVASAGASGALFGLVGVLFIFGIKFRRELPEGFRRAFGTGMLPIIIINLVIGFIGRGFIDNAAHLGGLVSGAALATVVQYRRVGERRGVAAAWRVVQVLALLLVVVAFYKTVRNFNRSLQLAHLPALNQQTQMVLSYIGTMNALRIKTTDVIENRNLNDVGGLTQLAVQAPAPDERAGELRERLVSIISRAANEVASASPAPGPGPRRPPPVDQKLVDEFQQWNTDYDQWLAGATRH
ncbi:MAG TPA: rhomboid family intramembrane serine protease [Pyrinomonadaceae bacterium]|nr:rhomboid family intramembrane serine protease [Pyrinomonadaceae bacterium]